MSARRALSVFPPTDLVAGEAAVPEAECRMRCSAAATCLAYVSYKALGVEVCQLGTKTKPTQRSTSTMTSLNLCEKGVVGPAYKQQEIKVIGSAPLLPQGLARVPAAIATGSSQLVVDERGNLLEVARPLSCAAVIVSSRANVEGYKSMPLMDTDWCSGDTTKQRVYVPEAWATESMAYLARTRWARIQTRQVKHRGTRTFSEGKATSSSQRAHVFLVKSPLRGMTWKLGSQ